MGLNLYSTDDKLVCLKNAFVVPPKGGGKNTRRAASGVFDAQQNFVEQSQSWSTSEVPLNSIPTIPENVKIERLNGRYIFGGILYGHFGHFAAESIARIWALDHVDGKVDGMIFTPKFENFEEKFIQRCTDYGRLLGLNIPIVVAKNVTNVEELYVPAQGIGMFDLAEGSPEFKSYIRKHAGVGIKPEGRERLYVSRTQLRPGCGSILGESRLEEYLAQEGYEIFHPQKFTLAEQIARYKAAKKIISLDSSPVHILAYVGNSSQTAGIIARRSLPVSGYLAKQLEALSGMKVVDLSCLVNDWIIDRRPSRRSRGEVDFPKLREGLITAGLIEGRSEWVNLSIEERTEELKIQSKRHNHEFVLFKKVAS